jgi:hypothetical protein
MTAVVGLYQVLKLPLPRQAATGRQLLIAYREASAVGALRIRCQGRRLLFVYIDPDYGRYPQAADALGFQVI